MTSSSIALRISRIAAVLLALTVLGYLAFEAQRRANPPERAGAQPNAAAADAAPAVEFELVDVDPNAPESMLLTFPYEEPHVGNFLFSSKSGVIRLPESVEGEWPPFEVVNGFGASDPYLPSSKVLRVDVPHLPTAPPVSESDDQQRNAEEAP